MEIPMVILLVLAGLFALIGLFYAINIYNGLVQVKNNIAKAWKNIDVLLQQRHDELPKLVEACKGYLKHEAGVLENLTRLRLGYAKAAGVDEKARAENSLNREIDKLRISFEAYPQLQSSANFLQVQSRISALESSIADRREFFNDSVNVYNIQIESLPDLIMARLLGYHPHAFLEVPEEKKRDVKLGF